MFSEDASLNAKDKNGRTALYWAAQNGYRDIVAVLLDYGERD